MTARPRYSAEFPLRTCGNCEGQGGYEVAYAGRPPPWGDGADGGEWIACKYCGGSGWEEGAEPIEQDELPPPTPSDEAERLYLATESADLHPTEEDRRAALEDNPFQRMSDSDKGQAERATGWDRGEG